MFKKGISLLTAMLVLMSLATTTFAAVPTTSNELDDTTWKGSYWADDFDQHTADVESGEVTSDVFTITANENIKIDADAGKTGAAVVVTADTASAATLTWNVADRLASIQVGQVAVFSYDIKFSGLTNMSNYLWLSGGGASSRQFSRVTNSGSFVLYPNTGGSVPHATPVTENAWYTVVATINKLGTEGSYYEERSVSIYDANGAYCTGITNTQKPGWSDDWAKNFSLTVPKTNADTATITVDNATLAYYDMAKYAPGLTAAPAIANQTISPAEQKIVVSFDQPISGTATATLKNLTDNSVADVTCNATATKIASSKSSIFDAISPFDYTVTVPASALAAGTNYELVFDGFKNLAGTASTASVLFKTKDKTAQDMTMTADFTTPGAAKTYGNGCFYENYPLLSYIRGSVVSAENGIFKNSGLGETGWLTVKTSPIDGNHPNAPALYFSDFSKAYVLTYRMRIDSPATGDFVADFMAGVAQQGASPSEDRAQYTNFAAEFQSRTDGNHIVKQGTVRPEETSTTPGTWQPDTWYKVIWSVADGVQTYRLYDEATNELVFERIRPIYGVESASPTQQWLFSLMQQKKVDPWGNNSHELADNTACTAGVSLDDVTLWTLDKTQNWSKPIYVANSVDGETVTLTFDQPLLATGADYTVTNNTTGKVEQGVTVSITQLSDSSQKLSFRGLDFGTTYTLNYKDITNIAGQGLLNKADAPAITFTTGAYDAADGYVIVGNPAVSALTQGSTIGFNVYCPAAKTGDIFVALYNTEGELLGVEKYDLDAAAGGKVAGASVTLGKDYLTATSIKIFAWTNDLNPELLPAVRTIAE